MFFSCQSIDGARIDLSVASAAASTVVISFDHQTICLITAISEKNRFVKMMNNLFNLLMEKKGTTSDRNLLDRHHHHRSNASQ